MNKAQRTLTISTALVVALFGFGPLSLLGTETAGAQAPSNQVWSDWEKLTGKEKGFTSEVDAPSFAISTPSFYAVVVLNKLHISTDGGDTWVERSSENLPEMKDLKASADGSTFVLFKPEETGPMLMRTQDSSIQSAASPSTLFISTNQGATWQPKALGDIVQWKSASISRDGDTIVATGYDSNYTTASYISVDSGASWNQIQATSSGIELSKDGNLLYYTASMAIDDTEVQQLHSSLDNGQTWSTSQIDGVSTVNFVQASNEGKNFLLTGYDTAWNSVTLSSTDYGATWQPVVIEQGEVTASSWSQLFYTADSNIAYALIDTTSYQRAFIKTVDGGLNWTQLAGPASVSLDELHVNYDGTSLIIRGSNVGYSQKGVHISTDGGATWSAASPAVSNVRGLYSADTGNTLLLSADVSQQEGGLYTSSNNGSSWERRVVTGSEAWQNAVTSPNGKNVIAMTIGGRFAVSKNSGETWTTGTLNDLYLPSQIIISDDGQKIFVSGSNTSSRHVVYTSNNGGASWSLSSSSLGDSFPSTVQYTPDGSVISLTYNNAVYLSKNFGQTWQRVQIDQAYVNYAVSISKSGHLLAAASNGSWNADPAYYLSTDRGNTWTEIISPDNTLTMSYAFLKNSDFIVSTHWDSETGEPTEYISFDNGQNWLITNNPGLLSAAIASDDGSQIAVFGYTDEGLKLFLATDFSATLDEQASTASLNYEWINIEKVSNDGKIIVAHTKVDSYDNYIFTSRDGGASWSTNTWSSYNQSDKIRGISDDGMRIAVTYDGKLVTSFDAGLTWTEENIVNSALGDFRDVAVSDDVTDFYFAQLNGYIYGKSFGDAPVTPEPEPQPQPEPQTPSMGFTPGTSNNNATTPTSTNRDQPQAITNTKPTFSGKATPNSVVTVTVRSDPITCTTTADANGNWSCTLPSTIPVGVHTVTVEVTDAITEETTVLGPYYVSISGESSQPVTVTPFSPHAPNTGIKPELTVTSGAQPAQQASQGSVSRFVALAFVLVILGGLVALNRFAARPVRNES